MGIGRRRSARPHDGAGSGLAPAQGQPMPPLPPFQAILTDDRHTFEGREHRDVTVDGFELARPDGSPLLLSSDGPVEQRVFYFRVTGVGHHQGGAQSTSFAPLSQIYLLREPANEADPNALRVVGEDAAFAGYVPRELAAIISPMVDRASIKGTSGVVTRTFATARGRNAIEVLAVVGRNIDLRATFEDDGHYQPNIQSGFVVRDDEAT